MKLWIIILFCLVSTVQSAEILVRAEPTWMHQVEVDTMAWDSVKIAKYIAERDCQITYGTPVIVKPDDWPWGSREGLPKFIIIKIPFVTVSAVAKYAKRNLYDGDGKLLKERAFHFKEKAMDSLIVLAGPDGILETTALKAKNAMSEYVLP